ncbi:hypothetical protein [Salidesulfovibrio onnuriiensis]|uniref:hypothetical protein n=1 Tax=Salidesulfovibrio onnuriiensis TaxID=2583823 RepID=UPI0011C734B7|nr:hypothetical protein [Salidesulfovibrio onnuriiensis]
MSSDHFTELFDKDGNLIGCLLTADAWASIKPTVLKALNIQEAPPERPEPLADWETLKEYWDFPYAVDTDVHCDNCGESTENWQQDNPRKFRLSSANLAGLVSFTCQKCHAKITKKHFKDTIKVENQPYREKDLRKEGQY